MPLVMGMTLSPVLELKQQLMCTCFLKCSARTWTSDANYFLHNSNLGTDPETALSRGLCPWCYQPLPAQLTSAYSNRLAKWIAAELKKKVPFWRAPMLCSDWTPLQSTNEQIRWGAPEVYRRYQATGGCRGIFDYPSHEYKLSSLEDKRQLLTQIEEATHVNAHLIASACISYLTNVSREPYKLARETIREGWRILFCERSFSL